MAGESRDLCGEPGQDYRPEIAKLRDMKKKRRYRVKRKCRGLSDVIAYAVNAEKTRRKGKRGEEEIASETEQIMQQYVSGINCTPATARNEMMAVKKRYGKDEGIVAFHGYQSFAPGECTPALAHEIGVRLAQELWGERFQVLVATHLDKAHHLHNHFVVNSVSYLDGKRYHRTNQDYRDMRSVSDRLLPRVWSVRDRTSAAGEVQTLWRVAGRAGREAHLSQYRPGGRG